MRNKLLSTSAMLYAPETGNGNGNGDVEGDAPFVLTLGKEDAVGKYKANQTIKKARNVVDYLRQAAISLSDDDETKERIRVASSADIMKAATNADVTDLGDDTELDRRVQAVLDTEFKVMGMDEIPSMSVLPLEGTNAALAIKFGQYLSDETMEDGETIVQASITADAGPITVMHDVERDMGSKMEGNRSFVDLLPRIGSKFQPSKKNPHNPPLGYRTPGQANDPNLKDLPEWPADRYDYYEVEVKDEHGNRVTRSGRWVAEFTAAKFARQYADELDHLRAAARGTELVIDEKDATQRFYRDRARELRKQAVNGDSGPLDTAIAECARQFTKRNRMMDTALRLIEAKHYVQDVLTRGDREVSVVLYGVKDKEEPTAEQVAEASRLRKPFCFKVTVSKTDKGQTVVRENYGAPFEMSKLRGVIKRHHEIGDKKDLEPADLITPKKRKGAGDGAPTAETQPRVLAREVKDIGDLEETVYAVSNYVGEKDKRKLIRDACAKPNGGQLCSAIVRLSDLIDEIANDKAVRDRADRWDSDQLAAIAAAEKAERAA